MTTRDITEVLHVGGVYTGVPLTLEEAECERLETGMRREELCTGECPPVQPTQQSGNKYKPCIYCTAINEPFENCTAINEPFENCTAINEPFVHRGNAINHSQ